MQPIWVGILCLLGSAIVAGTAAAASSAKELISRSKDLEDTISTKLGISTTSLQLNTELPNLLQQLITSGEKLRDSLKETADKYLKENNG